MLQLPHPETKILFIIFHTPSGRKNNFYNFFHGAAGFNSFHIQKLKKTFSNSFWEEKYIL